MGLATKKAVDNNSVAPLVSGVLCYVLQQRPLPRAACAAFPSPYGGE